MSRTFLLLLALVPLVASCRSSTAPAERRVMLAILGDDIVYGTPGGNLPEPLQIVATDATTGLPVSGIEVQWSIVQGTATLTPLATKTSVDGMSEASFRGAALGDYRVRATTPRMVGATPEFQVRLVPLPQIESITPALIAAGTEVTIRGSNFSPIADHNTVLFDGVRGRVTAATTVELRVVAPHCLPNRSVPVTAALGFASSLPRPVQAQATAGEQLDLAPGQSRALVAAADLACIRVPAASSNALYLITTHNVSSTHAPPLRYELRSLTAGPITQAQVTRPTLQPFAESWEHALRRTERQMLIDAPHEDDPFAPAMRMMRDPVVGENRDFNVITRTNSFQKVTATLRSITPRTLIFVDTEAPANGFSPTDLADFAALFESVIYNATTAVFGQPSDIDGNSRIIILFTPRINALTPRGESSFAAGYFYGCDLLTRARCSGSNLGEIFYSMVPDPGAVWSDRRTTAQVLQTVPGVLAHEFQHMIHFARRGMSADVVWLSEALAHTAEEIVGEAIRLNGGTNAQVNLFKGQNYLRAQRYLADPASISLLADDPPGSLELRGVAWLLLKHLRGHYGGDDLLRRLTGSSRSGVANVVQETNTPWSTLLTDFGVAIWADGAPELGALLRPQHLFADFAPRTVLTGSSGYPLRPVQLAWGDFFIEWKVAAASQESHLLTAPVSGGPDLNFVVSGPRGAAFPANAPITLTVLRVR